MKQFLLAILLLAPILTQAQAPTAYTIRGTIGKLNAPAKVYLWREVPLSITSVMRRIEFIDSATLVNSKFELRGTTDIPTEATLGLQREGKRKAVVTSPADRVQLFLEPGLVVLTSTDSLSRARIRGSQLSTDYRNFTTALQPVYSQTKAIDAIYPQASAAERNSAEFQQRLRKLRENLHEEKHQQIAAFIKARPNSWVSLHALLQIMPVAQYAETAPLYEALSPTLKNSATGRQYGAMLQELKEVAVGEQAPAFSQPTPTGQLIALSDYQGKYVLVEFWASWCAPCRAETPNLIRAHQTYKNRRFDVLSVSLDSERGRAKWLKAIEDDHATWTQVADLRGFEGEAAKRYHIQAIPQNFLVDPPGKIVAVNLRGDALLTTLARLLPAAP